MNVKQNTTDLNGVMKHGSKASQDKVKNIIDWYVDRKIINFKTARNIVVQIAHPTGYNKNRS